MITKDNMTIWDGNDFARMWKEKLEKQRSEEKLRVVALAEAVKSEQREIK